MVVVRGSPALPVSVPLLTQMSDEDEAAAAEDELSISGQPSNTGHSHTGDDEVL